MFVRQKRNRSGSVSVQVIDKTNGYRVVKTIGSARRPEEIQRLVELGKRFIARQSRQYSLFPAEQRDNAVILDFVETLDNASIRTMGPELIFGRLFDEIGFNAIPEELFRDIVVARLVYPDQQAQDGRLPVSLPGQDGSARPDLSLPGPPQRAVRPAGSADRLRALPQDPRPHQRGLLRHDQPVL